MATYNGKDQSPPHCCLGEGCRDLGPKRKADVSEATEWECKFCTFRNTSESALCKMCKGTKDVSIRWSKRMAKGSWECSKCTFRNKAKYVECKMCKEKKEDTRKENKSTLQIEKNLGQGGEQCKFSEIRSSLAPPATRKENKSTLQIEKNLGQEGEQCKFSEIRSSLAPPATRMKSTQTSPNKYKDVISPVRAYITDCPTKIIRKKKATSKKPKGFKEEEEEEEEESATLANEQIRQLRNEIAQGQGNVNPNLLDLKRDSLPPRIYEDTTEVSWEDEQPKQHFPKMGQKNTKILLAGTSAVKVKKHAEEKK